MGFALFLSAGGHIALLQGVAWATMIRDYSCTGSVTAAVEKTFDGKHPCPLCKKIAAQRDHEEKSPAPLKTEKKDRGLCGGLFADHPSTHRRILCLSPASFCERSGACVRSARSDHHRGVIPHLVPERSGRGLTRTSDRPCMQADPDPRLRVPSCRHPHHAPLNFIFL